MANAFTKWLDRLVEEKGINTEQVFEVEGAVYGTNFIPCEVVIENIKQTTPAEQSAIKNMLVKIDFCNGNVVDYFKHLAKALAI